MGDTAVINVAKYDDSVPPNPAMSRHYCIVYGGTGMDEVNWQDYLDPLGPIFVSLVHPAIKPTDSVLGKPRSL